MSSGPTPSTTPAAPATQADAARPVLHFTGRADLEATLRALRNDENATYAELARYMRIERALEPPHD